MLRPRQVHLRSLWGFPDSFQKTLILALTDDVELEIQEMCSDTASQTFEGGSQNYTNLGCLVDSTSLPLPQEGAPLPCPQLARVIKLTDRWEEGGGEEMLSKLSRNICRKLGLQRQWLCFSYTGPLAHD